jgi:tRNA modification GTPase
MLSRGQDTIYALSSGQPPAGVAVVRVSGTKVPDLLRSLLDDMPEPRRALLKSIRDRNGQLIDQGIVLNFPAPQSFTGEDCCEFQLHGGRAVIEALLTALREWGLRHAEAGEFTRRAFDNGKLDLVEIEGLADLIAAETEMQRRLAIQQSSGALSALYQSWMQRLTRARALIEAELDFPEEDDIPGAISDRVWASVEELAGDIRRHLDDSKSAEIIRDGFKVVIAGRPNAGKSSLMNALAKRDVAIVTEIAGTTRDLIAIDLDLGGYLVHLIDTAGLRETSDRVEAEGVRRARLSLVDADMVLLLKDAMDTGPYERIDVKADVVRVRTKVDLVQGSSSDADVIDISSITGDGINSLTKRISGGLLSRSDGGSGQALVARRRQVALLSEALALLQECARNDRMVTELRAEFLRRGSHVLGKLTGFVDTEDLLAVIFSEFCIGK